MENRLFQLFSDSVCEESSLKVQLVEMYPPPPQKMNIHVKSLEPLDVTLFLETDFGICD